MGEKINIKNIKILIMEFSYKWILLIIKFNLKMVYYKAY